MKSNLSIKSFYMSGINNDLKLSGYLPNLSDGLKFIDIKQYYFNKHGLRHPSAMYIRQLDKLGKSFLKLLQEINKDVNDESDPNEEHNTSDLFVDMINKFNSFIDVFQEITVGFYDIKRTGGFIYRDLRDNNIYTYDKFYSLIKDDIQRYKELGNHFKHTSNYIEFIKFYGKTGKAIGYFITKSEEDGKVLSDEKFHPKWRDKHTGNSFNKELREVFYLIYKISDLFEYHIVNGFKNNEKSVNEGKTEKSIFEDIYIELNKLDEYFFPNEENNMFFSIKIKGNRLKIQEKFAKNIREERKFSLTYSGDGVSNQFGLLY